MRTATLSLTLLAASAVGQRPPEPGQGFEVVSIKPSQFVPPPHGERNCSAGGRFVSIDMPMKDSVMWAYDVKFYQISEVPDWFDSFQHTYNIEARTASSGGAAQVSEDQCKRMVRALFEDRFKLKVHRETRQLPVWALTVAKSGAKLHEAAAGSSPRPGGGVRINGRPVQGPPGGEPPRGWTMQQLVNNFLGMPALGGRPVVDRTGLTGIYEIDLDYSILPGGDRELRDAVQDLGLRLEEAKAPIDFLVVDHVERPSDH
jgi:uncharacterized protein (TIGR03435 family)